MKLAFALTLSLLVSGCGLLKPAPKSSPLAAAATSSLATTQKHLADTHAKLKDAVEKQSALVEKLRENATTQVQIDIANAMSQNCGTFTECANELETEGTDLGAARANVEKLTKENETLRAEVTKLKAADRPNVKWIMYAGIGLVMLGFFAFIRFDKPTGIGLMGMGGIGIAASIFIPQIETVAPYVVYAMAGTMVCAFVYSVFKYTKSKQALRQVVTGNAVMLETLKAAAPPVAALATMQLQATQDRSTSDTVNKIKADIDPDMVRREVAKAAVVSALPEMTQATVATPGVAATGSPAGTATIQSGPLTTMTGPAVAPVVVPVPAPQVVYVPAAPQAPASVQPGQTATIGVGAGASVEGTVIEAGPKPP